MKKLSALLLSCLLLFCCQQMKAQRSAGKDDVLTTYRKAVELFDKEKYGQAQHQFELLVSEIPDENSEMRINAEYYASVCSMKLFNRDAESLITAFISNHPESPYVKKAQFQLGAYNYRKKKWAKAVYWFNKVDVYALNNDELSAYYFKLGYSYFRTGDKENALKSLYEIKDADTKYTLPARYYYGHIAYTEGQYQTALNMFEKIQHDPKFGPIVPYYITQILYLQHKYDELLAYAPALLDSAIPQRAPEIAHLIGDAYYREEAYEKAIPYLERYAQKGNTNIEDEYQLGYAYYKTRNYDKAIKLFKRLGTAKDEITQAAFYYLGDCYRKQGKPLYARNAYMEASKLSFDPQIQEDALYNYAMICYASSYDPYNEAIEALNLYLDKYPESEKRDQIYAYLVHMYSTTNDYEGALASLEKIKQPDIQLQAAYQRLTFNLAVQEYSNNRFKEAVRHFRDVSRYNEEKELITESIFWIAESEYKLGLYEQAIQHYRDFIYAPGAILNKRFIMAYYNAGYASFKLGDYAGASIWFRKFTDEKHSFDYPDIRTDAFLRIADASFVSKDYFKAEKYYKYAVECSSRDADYALYQRAIALGLLQRKTEKIQLLDELLANYSNSRYLDDAMYQLGRYWIQEKPEKSVAYFERIVKEYPNSQYSKEAMLQQGIVYHNLNKDEQALQVFKKIAHNYRSYGDSREAISYARNIYIEKGRVEDFKKWIASLDYYHATVSSLDSADYEAAYLIYVNGDYNRAAKAFDQYLSEYKNPLYALKAHYYKADCDYHAQRLSEALGGYNYVIDQGANSFMVSSLLYASRINYHFQQYQEALNDYMMLEKLADTRLLLSESIIGQMRCFAKVGNFSMAMQYANRVLNDRQTEGKIQSEAHAIIASSAMAEDNLPLAIKEYQFLAENTNSEMSAESRYRLASIYFRQKAYDEAERAINELMEKDAAYKFWIAKGMLLLADIFLVRNEIFQAKTTLQSLIKHYEGDETLIREAQTKLKDIIRKEKEKEAEARQRKEKARNEIFEIVFDSDHFDIDSLFGEDMETDEPLKVELIENE